MCKQLKYYSTDDGGIYKKCVCLWVFKSLNSCLRTTSVKTEQGCHQNRYLQHLSIILKRQRYSLVLFWGCFFLRNVGTKAAILLELMGAESTYNCSNPLFHTEEEGDTPSPTSTPKTTCERWQLVCSTSSYFADKKGSIHVCVAILKCSRLMALPL